MNVDTTPDVKRKWKRGFSKLRRQSTVSETSPTLGTQSIMEEDTTENEMQDYLSKLKKKTGLNMLWSGRKFEETIDREPDIDLTQPVMLSTLRDMTLDSDEEDLHKFIQNLSEDEEESMVSEKQNLTKSSNSDINLMKNINFADVGPNAYGSLHVESEYEDDFMPLIVQPNFPKDSDESNGDSKSQSSFIFNKNIKLVDNDLSVVESQHSSFIVKNNLRNIAQNHQVTEGDLSEEISEVLEESRTKTPAKSFDYNYTFDTYESEAIKDEESDSSKTAVTVEKAHKNSREILNSLSHHESLKSSDILSGKQKKKNKKSRSKHRRQQSSSSELSSSFESNSDRRSASKSKSSSYSTSRSAKTSSSGTITGKTASYSTKSSMKSKENKQKTCSTQTKTVDWANNYLPFHDELLKMDINYKTIDPTPIAGSVVSNEAIQAVTTFNPSSVALNDLLKYQLQLTRQHIDNSWRLYRAYATPGRIGAYKYTTLKDTMKYIKNNAPSVISYEEALREIKKEQIL